MKEHTYQLTVELQVHSARTNPKDVEARWGALLSQLVAEGDDDAVVSAIKCADARKQPREERQHREDVELVLAALKAESRRRDKALAQITDVDEFEDAARKATRCRQMIAERERVLEAPEEQVARRRLIVGCDMVHPESGEALAVPDDTFVLPHPTAEHIIAVARAYPHFYVVVGNAHYIIIADATMTDKET